MKEEFESNISFKGFIKLLAFSLAKGDGAVFSFMVDTLVKDPDLLSVKEHLMAEEQQARQMVYALSGEEELLWYRPWLAESIKLRGSSIHPLSVIELAALRSRRMEIPKQHNDELLRIAIAGTAIGMLTTG